MPVRFVYHGFAHHADLSGYAQIVRYIENIPLNQTAFHRFINRHKGIKDRMRRHTGLTHYSEQRLLAEADAIFEFIKRSGQIFHYLYADNFYFYLGKLRKVRKNLIVGSYHQPPEFFKTIVKDTSYLRELDAIITVSRSQIGFYEEIVGRDKVFYIPHGIDTEYFRPTGIRDYDRPFQCLFVGGWLRDIEFLKCIINKAATHAPHIRFHLLSVKQFHKDFEGLKNVKVHDRVTDTELLHLYNESHLLFLPLKNATANNSILEAFACGLPVMTTDVGGIQDYIDNNCSILFPSGDVDYAMQLLTDILNDPVRLQKMSVAARKRAMEFDWPVIAGRVLELYSKLMGQC